MYSNYIHIVLVLYVSRIQTHCTADWEDYIKSDTMSGRYV